MERQPTVNLHAFLARSTVNGPGPRSVIWFQGCKLACPGCINPHTHTFAPKLKLTVASILERIISLKGNIEGASISGGEPFAQPEALLALVSGMRRTTTLSVLLFSGYTMSELRRQALGPAVLELTDVLVSGRYVRSLHSGRGLIGSTNQSMHILSDRYTQQDLEAVPECEVHIGLGGVLLATGIQPLENKWLTPSYYD